MHLGYRYKQTKKVTWIAVIANIFLSVFKLLLGFLGHSQGLVADGVHSVSDILTDAFVLMGAKAGSQAPDESHPYGHGRIETVFTILLAAFLIIVGFGIAGDALYHIFVLKQFSHPHAALTLSMAAISVLINEALFRYTFYVSKKIDSELLAANAWHHRSDSLSSLVVFAGIIGAAFGFYYLDAVAAVIVAILVIHIGFNMIRKSVRELIDTSADNDILQNVFQELKKIQGIKAVHQLRSRSLGGKVYLDLHIQVDAKISVSEGHYIGNQAHNILMNKISKIADIVVHVDVEDDEKLNSTVNLPNRYEIKEQLQHLWQDLPGVDCIDKMYLHYVSNKIFVEIFLPLKQLNEANDKEKTVALVEKYRNAVQNLSVVAKVDIYFY